jgi:predicted transposase/invertase (TIGR01784 family)
MFGTEDIKRTHLAQELLAEGRAEGELKAKLKIAPQLLVRGFSVEEVAEVLELNIERVRQAAQEN